jgi:hypothetical protein
MQLRKIKTLEIVPTAPFYFDPTFFKPDHFTSGDSHWEPGTRWQTWSWEGEHLGLKFRNQGSISKPRLQIDVYGGHKMADQVITSLADEIRYRYNLDLNLSDFYKDSTAKRVVDPPQASKTLI